MPFIVPNLNPAPARIQRNLFLSKNDQDVYNSSPHLLIAQVVLCKSNNVVTGRWLHSTYTSHYHHLLPKYFFYLEVWYFIVCFYLFRWVWIELCSWKWRVWILYKEQLFLWNVNLQCWINSFITRCQYSSRNIGHKVISLRRCIFFLSFFLLL